MWRSNDPNGLGRPISHLGPKQHGWTTPRFPTVWYEYLTHVTSFKAGYVNGLGAIQFAAVVLSVIGFGPSDRRSDLLLLAGTSTAAGLLVLASDLSWRRWLSGETGWYRWFGPTAGGSLSLVPGWMVGSLSVAFGAAVAVRAVWFLRP